MSITKKCFFVSMLVILPMMALLLISSLILDSQLEKSALSYLNVATKIFKILLIAVSRKWRKHQK